MKLVEQFEQFIQSHHLLQPGDKVLLAVSGGVDSAVMVHLFREAGFKPGIAHCNFQLRGEESWRDADFVRSLASQWSFPFYTVDFATQTFADQNKLSIQAAARKLRYDWLELIRQQHGYQFIATAHHQNDNIETLLMNFFKGTGMAGMHGILPRQGRIIRPLLFATKEQLQRYAEEQSLSFVEDSSNYSDKYTRNFLRLNVLPRLQEIFPQIMHNLAGNIERFREAEQLYQQALEQHKKKLLFAKGAEWLIPIRKLLKAIPLSTIAYEIFREFGFSFEQTTQILNFLTHEPGKTITSATHRLIKDRQWLIITPLQEEETVNVTHLLITPGTKKVRINDQLLYIQHQAVAEVSISADPHCAFLDAESLEFPLLLRKWKPGDYFYPLGMRKKKKLSRFFIDQKLSLADKEKIWVLESNHRIAWVLGLRIDERFKIRPGTKKIISLKLR